MTSKAGLWRALAIIGVAAFLIYALLLPLAFAGRVGSALLGAVLLIGLSAPLINRWVLQKQTSGSAGALAERASRAQFRALLDSVAEGAVFVDVDGRIRHANRKAEQLFGFERTELINQPVELLVPERFRESHVRYREAYTANPNPVPMGIGRELVGRRRDGSEFPLELSLSPIEGAEGRQVLALVTNIAARRRLEDERKLLALAVEQSSDAVVITDAEGAIQYVNSAFEQMTGYSRAEVYGRNPSLLKSGMHDAEFFKAMWETLKEGRVWQSNIINRRKDGTLYEQESTITPVKDLTGQITHYVAASHDTSAAHEPEVDRPRGSPGAA